MNAEPDLVALSDAGLHALDQAIPLRSGGRVEELDGMMFATSPGHDAPFIVNGAIRLDPRVPAADAIARTLAYYSALGRTAGMTTHAQDDDLMEALTAQGWDELVELAGMVAMGRVERVAPGSGVTISKVDTSEGLADMISVLAESFGPEEPWPSMWSLVFRDLSTIDPSTTSTVIAYADGEPAAAAVGYAFQPVGVVGMVGTIARFGRRGLGELVTREVTAGIQEISGAPAALQSSPMARALYERIGFRPVTSYRLWSAP